MDLILSEYQPQWPTHFRAAATEIEAVFRGVPTSIEHIGSTSIVGLCAKPVIDIALGVEALSQVNVRIPSLADIGYSYRSEYEKEIPERRYFVRPAGRLPRIHLHVVETGNRLWLQHLAFREALRTAPALAAQYSQLKRTLAVIHASDKAGYTNAKASFIAQVLASSLPDAA